MRLFSAIAAIVTLLLVFPDHAQAQDRPALDVRTWRPSTDPNASLVVEPAITPGPGVLTLGAFGHYSYRPVVLRRPGSDAVALRPVAHSFGVDPIVNFGIGKRLALGATLPVLLFHEGDSNLPPSVIGSASMPRTGIGDVAMNVKGTLVRNEQGGFGVGAIGYLTLPTGNTSSFVGEGGPTAAVRVIAEYTLLVAVAQASLGYKFRSEHQTWPERTAGGVRFGDEIPWSLGIAMRPGIFGIDPRNRQRVELAFHGAFPAGPVGPFGTGEPGSAALSPAMMTLSDRIEVGHYRDVFLTLGGELGLNQAVGVPVFRGIVGIGWTPRAHDLDRDGIKDDIDGCPDIPEDKDGFEDNDGCPEIDNDQDDIVDKEDACPNVKGVPSKDPKKNGCPIDDADGDGIDDAADACPKVKGVKSEDPKANGCPAADSDGDGIDDTLDKCKEQPEDKDGFEDGDGCPDPDNDKDGVADAEDACPNEGGVPSTDPKRNGCPSPDRDGDAIPNDVDKCPDAAEVYNGVDDEDGCPDEGGKALVTIDEQRRVRLARPIKLGGSPALPEVDPSSMPTVRALALELNKHPDWTLAVGARPAGGGQSSLDALAKSFAIVRVLSEFTHRDGAAETVGWDAVKAQPQAETGVAFLLLAPPKAK